MDRTRLVLARLDPFPKEAGQFPPVCGVEVRSPEAVLLRSIDADFTIQMTPAVAPSQEGRELAGLVKDRRLPLRLPLRVRPSPVEEPGDLLGVDVGDFVLGETGNGVGVQKGDDRQVPLVRLVASPLRMRGAETPGT